MRDWIRDSMVDAYRLCTPAIRIAGGMGFGGWDLVEVVDLIGTIVGKSASPSVWGGCFVVRSELSLERGSCVPCIGVRRRPLKRVQSDFSVPIEGRAEIIREDDLIRRLPIGP